MGSSRWLPFLLVVGVLAVLAWVAIFWPQPIPQVGCDETEVFPTMVTEAVALGGWAHKSLMHLAIVGLLFTSTLFYFQVFHWIGARLAPFVATIAAATLAGGVTFGLAFAWVEHARRWADQQVPSCLDQALSDPLASSHAAWSGGWLRHMPSLEMPHWTHLLMVDATALVVVAVFSGWGLYRLGRRLHRF